MTKDRYKEIRTKKDFLFLYYKESVVNAHDQATFGASLGIWLEYHVGVDYISGLNRVVNYLDQLFEYKG